jgi:hypothetical protein
MMHVCKDLSKPVHGSASKEHVNDDWHMTAGQQMRRTIRDNKLLKIKVPNSQKLWRTL